MKKLIYILFLLFGAQTLIAQNKLTNAIYNLKNGEIEKAKELIDAASVDTMFSDNAATWYYKGFIYKNLFKEKEADNKQSPYRDQAVEFYKKGLELEPDGAYSESMESGLKYLAQTYFNHCATSFDPQNYKIAIENYEKYKDIIRTLNPEEDFTEKDINFKLALASTYGRIAQQDTATASINLEKSKKLYEEILVLDSNNINANYNLGILYYNEGVEIVNNMDYSLDLFELNAVQDQIIELFRESLPYMKKAYDLNPNRKETLIGLQGIYFSLNDIPKSEAYKKELDMLKNTGGEEEEMKDSQMQEPVAPK